MLAPDALACDAQKAQAAATATPRMVLPIEFRAMPNLLLRVNALWWRGKHPRSPYIVIGAWQCNRARSEGMALFGYVEPFSAGKRARRL